MRGLELIVNDRGAGSEVAMLVAKSNRGKRKSRN